MEFSKYQHLEKFGRSEVLNINLGTCYVFPKIDGTNGSIWVDDDLNICCGSRNRHLSEENDNAGFCKWVSEQKNIVNLLSASPELRLFGEWLVPHSLKTYRDDTWRKFYVFDIYDEETGRYLTYEELQYLCQKHEVVYVPCQKIIKNGTYEDFVKELESNHYLIKDGEGIGEGVVIKNYDFINSYGRVTWAKIVNNEFKEKHMHSSKAPSVEREMIEKGIIDSFLSEHLIEKCYDKIRVSNNGFNGKDIPELFGRVWNDFIIEEFPESLKKFKNPVVDFKTLKFWLMDKIKKTKSNLF